MRDLGGEPCTRLGTEQRWLWEVLIAATRGRPSNLLLVQLMSTYIIPFILNTQDFLDTDVSYFEKVPVKYSQ